MLRVDLKQSTFIFFTFRSWITSCSIWTLQIRIRQPAPWFPLFIWRYCLTARFCLRNADLKKQTNNTVSPRTAQNIVTDIKEKGPSKRREPVVVWHSESVETSEIELPYLPKFASSPFFGLNPEICSPHQQENDDVLFHGDFTDNVSEEIFDKFWPNTHPEYATKGFFGIALQKKQFRKSMIQLQAWIVGKREFLLHWERL